MELHPIRLYGPWDGGWALDRHTVSSEYVGDDPFGHPRFQTTRSPIGQLIYELKYQGNGAVVAEIAEALLHFLKSKGLLGEIDLVLPVPPTNRRQHQPVFLIAEELAEQGRLFYSDQALVKTTTEQAKGMSPEEKGSLVGSIRFTGSLKRPCNILLIDDIYQSGNTLSACVQALREDKNARRLYVVTMTKTARGGM